MQAGRAIAAVGAYQRKAVRMRAIHKAQKAVAAGAEENPKPSHKEIAIAAAKKLLRETGFGSHKTQLEKVKGGNHEEKGKKDEENAIIRTMLWLGKLVR